MKFLKYVSLLFSRLRLCILSVERKRFGVDSPNWQRVIGRQPNSRVQSRIARERVENRQRTVHPSFVRTAEEKRPHQNTQQRC